MYCCNALHKYSKSVSSTQVTILSLLLLETSMNVWLLMWYEQPGVRVSVQTTTQSLQASGTWTGRHFLWLTYSYNNRWNSRFVSETPREEAWRAVHNHGNAWYTNDSYTILSFIHRSRCTLVVLMPKISNYTRTRIELLYNQGFHR